MKEKNSKKKTACISITFDDGPHPQYTLPICKLLKQHHVPATFFFTGSHAEKYPEIVKQVDNEGHEIGNHGYSHSSLRWKNRAFIEQEIVQTDAILSSLLKKEITLFRPPYLRFGINLLLVLKKLKKQMVLADVSPKDFQQKRAADIVTFVMKKVKNGSVIVFHDGGKNQKITMQALEILLPNLKERGFQIVPMQENHR